MDDFVSLDGNSKTDTIKNSLSKLEISKTKKKYKSKKEKSRYNEEYNDDTASYYKSLRLAKMDPVSSITFDESDEHKAFKFHYMWDPFTGEKLKKKSEFIKDPYGPIYFNPVTLIKYFYENRLNKLWVVPADENDGYYQGYYGCAVGAGEKFYIAGRGYHPEWNIFRLPIPDCYLTNDHNNQFITMGPLLTYDEICKIHSLADKYWSRYYSKEYKSPMPSLLDIYKNYNKAISLSPIDLDDLENVPTDKRKQLLDTENRNAVNLLVAMKG
jgi:hypothetical protein